MDPYNTLMFNLHVNSVDKLSNIVFKNSVDNIPEYNIDYSRRDYLLIKKETSIGKEKVQCTSAIIFQIAFYQEPWSIILSIFLPFIILIVLEYLVFLSEGDNLSKLSNSATIILAALSF